MTERTAITQLQKKYFHF